MLDLGEQESHLWSVIAVMREVFWKLINTQMLLRSVLKYTMNLYFRFFISERCEAGPDLPELFGW